MTDFSLPTPTFGLFYNLDNFDEDLAGWDTSGVTLMDQMFFGATSFDAPLGFDTSVVVSVRSMFNGANAFNQPIGGWNVGRVTTLKLSECGSPTVAAAAAHSLLSSFFFL